MTTKKKDPNMGKVFSLLALSETQGGQAIETYIRACEALVAGFDPKSYPRVRGRAAGVGHYMAALAKESEARGGRWGRETFFWMWRVGQALKDGRAERETLLKATSRSELHRLTPRKRNWSRPISRSPGCLIRVSIPVHKALVKLAAKWDESIGDTVERLLAQATSIPKVVKEKAA